MTSLHDLLSRLNLINKKGLFRLTRKTQWKKRFTYSITRVLGVIKPDAFYYLKDKFFILFFDNPSEEKEKLIHKQIWNFNQAPVIFIIKSTEVLIYNGLHFDRVKSLLELIGKDDVINNFSFWNLQSGEAWKKYQNKFKNETRVDYYLLDNIQAGLTYLTEKGLSRSVANSLIGRLIFSRYLIDREVEIDTRYISGTNKDEKNKSLLALVENKNKEKLYRYFKYLKDKFNGNLFPIGPREKELVKKLHLNVLHDLFAGVELKTGQINLFNVYDFSIIPIELVSNIYEQFIGWDTQRESKAFYTPQFLVNYILSQTITPFINRRNTASCRVLDPACGSGIFLVETLRKIIEKALGRKKSISDKRLKKLLRDNIFGIDKDKNAINIAIFSLYITLLDYKEPKEIKTFKFPELSETNFFNKDFFDVSLKSKLGKVKFDFIIGNPPWGSFRGTHVDYCYSQQPIIPISDNQIAQAFLVRTKDFADEKTECSLIVTSKILYNLKAKEFRKYFLESFNISQVFELSTVRRQIFSKAIAPASIIFYKYSFGKKTSRNVIRHISLKPNIFFNIFKATVIEKYDDKKIVQQYLAENDWLWKVLLYGNILDFNFIRRLKEYPELKNIISRRKLHFGAGFIKGGNHLDSKLERLKLITDNSIYPYFIDIEKTRNLGRILFHRKGIKEAYKAPHLLIKRSIDNQPVLAYTSRDCIFPNLIYGLSGEDDGKNMLKNIGSALSSKLISYFLFLTASQWGVERDEVYGEEYLQLPICDNIINSVLYEQFNEISLIAKQPQKTSALLNNKNYVSKIDNHLLKINQLVSNLYSISDIENDLIDYALDVSMPLYRGKSEPYNSASDDQLRKYANIFREHFYDRFNGPKDYFQIDIYPAIDKYAVAMLFKTVRNKPGKNEIVNFLSNDKKSESLKLFNRLLSMQKITDDLFVKKDIKGFEKDFFYIIKPNEYKNWHPAIARLDLYEFMDAILNTGAKKEIRG